MRNRPLGFLLALLAIACAPAPAAGEAPRPAIAIVSPAPEQTVHDNEGRVPVSVAVTPADALDTGHRVRVTLDGRAHGAPRHALSFTLEGVERGEHTLQAELVDAGGRALAVSAPVKFYLWQASRLFPGRKP
ncbi:MAG TPA: hypothetical protein VNK67_12780 [Burkholderiales bacterium]|nr:hypothetical protein [Burkholderiales bacterium]